MKAGILALPETSVDSIELEDQYHTGYRGIEINHTHTTLSGTQVQHGVAADHVETTEQTVTVSNGITVNEQPRVEDVVTEFLLDTTGDFLITSSRDGTFLYDHILAQTNTRYKRAVIDVKDWVTRRAQDPEHDYFETWYTGTRDMDDDTELNYGTNARPRRITQSSGDGIGVGFEYSYQGTIVRGVLYESGYTAIFNPRGWGPEAYSAWIRNEIVPHSDLPEEDDTTQDTLPNGSDS